MTNQTSTAATQGDTARGIAEGFERAVMVTAKYPLVAVPLFFSLLIAVVVVLCRREAAYAFGRLLLLRRHELALDRQTKLLRRIERLRVEQKIAEVKGQRGKADVVGVKIASQYELLNVLRAAQTRAASFEGEVLEPQL